MFDRVTHMLDATAMRVRSLFYLIDSFTFCNISSSCSLIPKEIVLPHSHSVTSQAVVL